MANLDNVLQQLREEHKQAQGAIEKLRQAISTIESLNGNSGGMSVNGARPKKTISRAKRQTLQVRTTKNFSRRSKANRCCSKSQTGASESTAIKESSVVVVDD
jgi:hypothetical protein